MCQVYNTTRTVHRTHWRPFLGATALCTSHVLMLHVPIATGYLMNTLRRVDCKKCLKLMRKDKNITKTMWSVINAAIKARS